MVASRFTARWMASLLVVSILGTLSGGTLLVSGAAAADPKAAPKAAPKAKAGGNATLLLEGDDAAGPKVDPKAKQALDSFGKFYAGLKGFSVTVDINLNVEQGEQKQTQSFKQTFNAERPNKFSYKLDSKQAGATVVSDGTNLSAYIKGLEKYAVETAPADWTALFENPIVMGSVGLGNAAGVMVAILSPDPAKSLLDKTTSVKYGGVVDLDGVKCHLIKAEQEEVDWQLWIDAGKQPLVRQFVPDLAKTFARMAAQQKGKSPFENLKISNIVSYKDWQVNPKFDTEAFAFTAPESATKVDTLMDILTGGRKQEEPGPSPLLGKEAPAIQLETLDGGTLDLAKLKDKNVVILDFWATWCGPCVRAMPIIDKVASQYKDKGVLLYAVNIQEKPEEIKAFLEEAKIDVSVALDKEGEVAKAYLAAAIPQTVIIGKDGTVQVVRIGLLPNLEEQLAKDLEALLEGKNLAEETLAAAKKKADADKPAAEEKSDKSADEK